MSLSGLVGFFKTGTYTVTRQLPGSWIAGDYVSGGVTTLLIDADIQPANGEDLKILEVGKHSENLLVVRCDQELQAGGKRPDLAPPDSISIASEDYQVIAVAKPQGLNGDYYKALVARVVL